MSKCKNRTVFISIMLIILMVGSFSASADEIVLDNGDRLSGTVTRMDMGILTVETGYAAPIAVQTSRIMSIRTDNPLELHLTSGEVLKGTLSTDDKGNLLIGATGERGMTVFGWDKVSAVNPPKVMPSKWKGNVNLGATTQTGNAERTNITFGADATRKTDQERFSLRFLYNFAKDEDNVTARSYYGFGKYDIFFTKKFYGYLALELLKDKTKDLQLRTVVGPGVGYQFWDDAVKSLLLEAGLAYFSEDLKKGQDKDWIAARLASDFRYQFGNSVVFTDQLVVYPSLENSKDYKLRNEAAITAPLASGWSFRLANILEHDGNPPEEVKRNDWYWIAALQYSF